VGEQTYRKMRKRKSGVVRKFAEVMHKREME
jgi:hypothetical protein